MEGKEKLRINIYPPELEIIEDNKEKVTIKINENFTNDSNSEKIYENLLAENAKHQEILQKYKEKIISSLDKLISASTINPNKEYHLEKTFQCHDLPISKVYFNHKGNYFLTCSYDGDAYLWNRKTGEIKYPDSDIVYTTRPSEKWNYRMCLTHQSDTFSKTIMKFFRENNVFYADNEVGEIVRNYLMWSDSYSIKN